MRQQGAGPAAQQGEQVQGVFRGVPAALLGGGFVPGVGEIGDEAAGRMEKRAAKFKTLPGFLPFEFAVLVVCGGAYGPDYGKAPGQVKAGGLLRRRSKGRAR